MNYRPKEPEGLEALKPTVKITEKKYILMDDRYSLFFIDVPSPQVST